MHAKEYLDLIKQLIKQFDIACEALKKPVIIINLPDKYDKNLLATTIETPDGTLRKRITRGKDYYHIENLENGIDLELTLETNNYIQITIAKPRNEFELLGRVDWQRGAILPEIMYEASLIDGKEVMIGIDVFDIELDNASNMQKSAIKVVCEDENGKRVVNGQEAVLLSNHMFNVGSYISSNFIGMLMQIKKLNHTLSEYYERCKTQKERRRKIKHQLMFKNIIKCK